MDQRGLAGAVWADDGVQLAGFDVEGDVLGCPERAVILGEVFQLQRKLGHGALPSRPAMPPRANSTTRIRIGPKIIPQCSVVLERNSASRPNTAAPMMAPCSVPRPPSTMMKIRSPERCQVE